MRAKVRIRFLGGVADDPNNNLTGSCSLLQVEQGKKRTSILIDSGLIQCGFNDSLEKNQAILKQLKPDSLDYIILTHAHIDHIGRLPLFVRHGFQGRIICTEGSRSLLNVMLEDSAKIQMLEAGYLSAKALKELDNHSGKNGTRDRLTRGNFDRIQRKTKNQKVKARCLPLYTQKDVEATDELIKNGGYEYYNWLKLAHGISIKFYPSGHVMGGAIVVFRIDSKPKDIYLCFSGDLGRRDGIILPPPEVVDEEIDHLILESTYGGKSHPPRDEEINKILNLIKKAAKNKQRVIIPSFALERSQEIIYLLSYYMEQGEIPRVPIYLDSPLASRITSVFANGWDQGMFSDQNRLGFNPFNPFKNPYFGIITGQEESDALIAQPGSYIVIAGSGMCDAGRVRGHLRANLDKTDTIVCLVGYMAENSLGRRLKDGAPTVKMNSQEIIVKAEIVSFDSFSAHADGLFLADYAQAVLAKNPDVYKQIFLVHGEKNSAYDLKTYLEENLPKRLKEKTRINVPKINQEETLN